MVGKKTLVVGLVGASAGILALVLVLGSAAAAGASSARTDAAPPGHAGLLPPGPPAPGFGNGTGNATGNATAPGPCPGMGGPGGSSGNDTAVLAGPVALRA